MDALLQKDVDYLRERFTKKGGLWAEWEYKLRGGALIIYSPVVPYNPETSKPDPKLRYMCKHLRIVPVQPGPFALQYWRHTQKWEWLPFTGELKEIADAIEEDAFGLCAPMEP